MGAFGVDPETMGEVPMDGMTGIPDLMSEGTYAEPGVDPGSPPADPMLDQEAGDEAEAETRERVELTLLLAIETCAKGVDAGVGAENADFAQAFGQSAASLAQAYEALCRTEAEAERIVLEADRLAMDHAVQSAQETL